MRGLGATLAAGATPCVVCGGRLRGAVLKLPDGRFLCLGHASDSRCRGCGIPLGALLPPALLCGDCHGSAVVRGRDVVPVKDDLKRHMAELGIVVAIPTRINLVASSAVMSDDPHVLGTTSWTRSGGYRVSGPITIKVLRGLPLAHFRHIIGHEFAHAAMVGTLGMASLGPRVIEGFAESLALVHLRRAGGPGIEHVEASMANNPDQVYGDGLRLVLPAVERRGLPTVLEALQLNRPRDVGLPRR